MAISDGPMDKSTGRIFFYLTDFDQTAIDLKVQLHISEALHFLAAAKGLKVLEVLKVGRG